MCFVLALPVRCVACSDRKLLADEDFEKLEDLAWEGSEVVMLNRQETRFLNAMSAYLKGTPIISDEEFDALKVVTLHTTFNHL
jgi:hypothetical protein